MLMYMMFSLIPWYERPEIDPFVYSNADWAHAGSFTCVDEMASIPALASRTSRDLWRRIKWIIFATVGD